MKTYKIILEYEGTRYHGWQVQPRIRTIQGILIKLCKDIFESDDLEIYGAGRTDKGVHALGQVAHLKVNSRIPDAILRLKLNDALPSDVSIISVESVPNTFHARKNAEARSYIYQISTRRTAFGKPFVWWIKDSLNFEQMQTAAVLAKGKHNFSLLSEKNPEIENSVVDVYDSRFERVGDLLVYRICASHFLWKMVRKIVTELVTIGRGQKQPDHFQQLLENRKGLAKVEVTAPPSGLFLEKVYYDKEYTFHSEIKSMIRI